MRVNEKRGLVDTLENTRARVSQATVVIRKIWHREKLL